MNAVVVEVIEHLRPVVEVQEGQRDRTGARVEAKTRMPFAGGGLAGLAIDENDLEPAGGDLCAGREGPLGEVGVIVREIEAVERNGGRGPLVEVDPGIGLV